MRRLVLAELAVLAAAASVALLLLVVHCCRRIKWPPSPTEPLPVWEPRLPPSSTTKERPLERLRRVLLRLCSRRSRVEPAATSPDAQREAVVTVQQVAAAAGPEEEVAAWRERWFGSPRSRALYTIEEESASTVAASDGDGDGESQCEGDHQHQEPETPFYTPAASPQREAEKIS